MSENKKTKWVYVLVLLLPGLYFWMYKSERSENVTHQNFHFYTSIKSKQIESIQLIKNEKQITEWIGSLPVYKQLDYIEAQTIESTDKIQLRINHKNTNDTIYFLGLNILNNKLVHSFQTADSNLISCSPNSKIILQNNQLVLVSLNQDAINLNLHQALSWPNNSISFVKWLYIILVTLLLLISLLLFKPSNEWFLVSIFTSVFSLFYFHFLGKDPSGQIQINGFESDESAVFFYNSAPEFNNSLSVKFTDSIDVRKTQAYPGQYSFYRIDFPDKPYLFSSTSIRYAMGFFSKHWELNNLPAYELNGNDLDLKQGILSVAGNDTFICLTGAQINKTIQTIDYLRLNLYYFLSSLTFFILLVSAKFFKGTFHVKHFIYFPFLIICCSCIILGLVDERRLIMNEEKRLAFPFIHFSKDQELKIYTKQLELYLKDQLPGRSQLIISNNLVRYKIFSELANNSMVYFGKENWMFYIGENVKGVYENKRLYTEEELNLLKKHLEERRDWLAKKGIAYYVFFPRMSHYFYQEKIGKGLYQYNKQARLIQFIDFLKKNSTINVIDVYTPMLRAKKSYQRDLYYHSDSHWNLFGAYFAYEEIIHRLKENFSNIGDPIPLKEIEWLESESNEADLSKLISLSNVITRHEYIPLHPAVNSATPIATPNYPEYQSVHPLLSYRGSDSAAPKLLMNRDSYSNFLIPYFSKHFSKQTYVWSPLFFPTIIEKEKPDIVVTEMMERFLDDLLIENPELH